MELALQFVVELSLEIVCAVALFDVLCCVVLFSLLLLLLGARQFKMSG